MRQYSGSRFATRYSLLRNTLARTPRRAIESARRIASPPDSPHPTPAGVFVFHPMRYPKWISILSLALAGAVACAFAQDGGKKGGGAPAANKKGPGGPPM